MSQPQPLVSPQNASKITASENVYLALAGRQTLWTQIRLLLQEQSDLGPHCSFMRLQIFYSSGRQKHIFCDYALVKAANSVTMNIFRFFIFFLNHL